MGLIIDFFSNYADRCAEMLAAADYDVPAGDAREIIRVYFTVQGRRVRSRPRRIHKARYHVAPHLIEGEALLLRKVRTGADLWPHQSRKIKKTAVEDEILNDFGIQHFHLGTRHDSKHQNLIEGTKELLFAVVTDTEFYAIGIYDHDCNAWSKQALLDAIHTTWPSLMADSTVNAIGLSAHYTDGELAQLRAAGVNVVTQRPDGTVHLPLGGGVTTAKTSAKVAQRVVEVQYTIGEIQNKVVKELAPLTKNGKLPVNATVSLTWRDEKAFALTSPGCIKIPLFEFPEVAPL